MSPIIRALFAALLVAVVAVAGAFFISLHSAGDAQATPLAALGQPAPSGDQLASLAFRQVEHVYYKPVGGQTLLNGERTALLAALKGHVTGRFGRRRRDAGRRDGGRADARRRGT